MVPIFKYSTIFLEHIPVKRNRYTYGLHGTETSRELENKIGQIERARYVSIYPSGLLSIIILYLALLESDDVVYVPLNIYEAHLRGVIWLKTIMMFHIIVYSSKFSFRNVSKRTRLVWMEIPTSIFMECSRIRRQLIRLKRNQTTREVYTVVDNSYFTSFFYKPLQNNIDISIVAMTKFFSAKNDICLGAVSTNSEKISRLVLTARKYIGMGVSMDDCYQILRNITMVKMYILIHERNSLAVIKLIHNLGIAKKIMVPNMRYARLLVNGLFSFSIFEKSVLRIYTFIKRLKLFKFGYSWGGDHSLIMYYRIRDEYIIRIFVGLEDPNDLQKDIKQAVKLSGIQLAKKHHKIITFENLI
ncbi:PLP-dependent transferase [Candidatus Vidania fulgoroideorum]